MSEKRKKDADTFVHYGRFVIAIFAILVAAAHLPYASISSAGASHQASGSGSPQQLKYRTGSLFRKVRLLSYVLRLLNAFPHRSYYLYIMHVKKLPCNYIKFLIE